MQFVAFLYRVGHLLVLLGIVDALTEPPVDHAIVVGAVLMLAAIIYAAVSHYERVGRDAGQRAIARLRKVVDSRS